MVVARNPHVSMVDHTNCCNALLEKREGKKKKREGGEGGVVESKSGKIFIINLH